MIHKMQRVELRTLMQYKMGSRRISTYNVKQTEKKITLDNISVPTTAVSEYAPASNVLAKITSIVITNVTPQNNRDISVFLDPLGVTWDSTTAIAFDRNLQSGGSMELIQANQAKYLRGTGSISASASNVSTFTMTITIIEMQL